MSSPLPNVYLSATTVDLRSVREAVKEALVSIGCEPVENTNFAPDWGKVADGLRQTIASCEMLIHIAGTRYGPEPDPDTLPPDTPRRSYAQWEYHLGCEVQQERGAEAFRVHAFICPEDFPYDTAPGIEVSDKWRLQDIHRNALKKAPQVVGAPETAEDVRNWVLSLREHFAPPPPPPPPEPPPLPPVERPPITVSSNPLAKVTGAHHAPPPVPIDEDVRFTVYRPQRMAPGQWCTWLAFAYRDPDDKDAPPSELEVKAIAGAVLGSSVSQYEPERQGSSAALPRESTITIVPNVEGLRFSPVSRTFTWHDAVHHEQFVAMAGPESLGKVLRGRVTFFLGALILAEVNVRVSIDGAAVPVTIPDAQDHARPYRKIFASYSHRDHNIVEHFEQMVAAYGDRYLRDVHHLRAGEVWNTGLEQMIADADIFQIFWSSRSMRSPYVRQEWEYALSLNRPYFIRPTYWEDPFPADGAANLPPEALSCLHFQKLPVRRKSKDSASTSPTHPPYPPAEGDPEATVIPGGFTAVHDAPTVADAYTTRASAPTASAAPPQGRPVAAPAALPPPPSPGEAYGSAPSGAPPRKRRAPIFTTVAAVGVVAMIAGISLMKNTDGPVKGGPNPVEVPGDPKTSQHTPAKDPLDPLPSHPPTPPPDDPPTKTPPPAVSRESDIAANEPQVPQAPLPSHTTQPVIPTAPPSAQASPLRSTPPEPQESREITFMRRAAVAASPASTLTPSQIGDLYVDRPMYNGKTFTREDVVREMQSFRTNWETKTYEIVDGPTVTAGAGTSHVTVKVKTRFVGLRKTNPQPSASVVTTEYSLFVAPDGKTLIESVRELARVRE